MPRSMMKIFSDSMGFYNNNLKMLLPISAMFGLLNVIEVIVNCKAPIDANSILAFSFFRLDFLLRLFLHFVLWLAGSFLLYWAIFFVNDFLAYGRNHYVESFNKIKGRILRLIILSIVLSFFYTVLGITMFFVASLIQNLTLFVLTVALLGLVVFLLGFYFIACHMEIILRDLSIDASIKKSFGIVFNFKSAFRFLYFSIVTFLSILVFFVPVGLLSVFIEYAFNGFDSMIVSAILSASILLVLIPFYVIFFVNFYNDLILRHEG